jgi:hypothetical protein
VGRAVVATAQKEIMLSFLNGFYRGRKDNSQEVMLSENIAHNISAEHHLVFFNKRKG